MTTRTKKSTTNPPEQDPALEAYRNYQMRRMELAEFSIKWHFATVPADMPEEILMVPATWRNVARKASRHDRIIVDAEDGSWTQTFLVRDQSAEAIWLSKIGERTDPVVGIEVHTGYEIRHRGPINKWSVIKGGILQSEGHETKQAAELWVNAQKRALEA